MSDASKKARVRTLFNNTAADWVSYYACEHAATLTAQNLLSRKAFALAMLEGATPRGGRILDLGCGTGEMTMTLRRRGFDVVGIDIAEVMMRPAARARADHRLQLGDVEHLPFRESSFDAVLCLGVMEYLDGDDTALREIHRVLKSGGTAVISTPSRRCPFYQTDRIAAKFMAVVRPLKYALRGRPLPPPDETSDIVHRKYVRGPWLALLRSHGLRPDDWVCHSWGWYVFEPFFPQAALCRAGDRFARVPVLNALASDQIVRVRAVKP